jgi:hypothetical protein
VDQLKKQIKTDLLIAKKTKWIKPKLIFQKQLFRWRQICP